MQRMKFFVGKTNQHRYEIDKELRRKWNDFALCNQVMIFNEFIGFKLYGLTCRVPKCYIGTTKGMPDKIFVEKPEGVMDFLQYLDPISVHVVICEKIDKNDKEVINKIQALSDLGIIFFTGLWLGDNDVFGKYFSNLLVVNGQVIKIDPAEVNLFADIKAVTSMVNLLERGLVETVDLFTQRFPMMGKVYRCLTREQLERALEVFNNLDESIILDCVEWCMNQIKDHKHDLPSVDTQVDNLLKRKKLVIDFITKKLNAINDNSQHDSPEFATSKPDKTCKEEKTFTHKTFKQKTVIRESAHFEITDDHYSIGNSKPYVYQKI